MEKLEDEMTDEAKYTYLRVKVVPGDTDPKNLSDGVYAFSKTAVASVVYGNVVFLLTPPEGFDFIDAVEEAGAPSIDRETFLQALSIVRADGSDIADVLHVLRGCK